jgi:hypothetical protein
VRNEANHAAHSSFATHAESSGLETGDQILGRQPELAVVTHSGLPAFRRSLVKNIVNDERV